MNLHNCFPLIPSFVWNMFDELARFDWLQCRIAEDGEPQFWRDLAGISRENARYVEAANTGVMSVEGSGANPLSWLWAMSRLLKDGPKVFRPTAEQCTGLEHVAINIPVTDYRQAYPTMLLEFPPEYRDDVNRRTGGVPTCPRFALVHHWPVGVVMTGCQVVDKDGLPAELIYLFGRKAREESIEVSLGIYVNADPSERVLLEAVTRVALNLMLLLAHSSSRLVPTDPAGLAKCRDKLKKGIRPDLQRREIAGHVHVVVPDREVLVREVRHAGVPADGAATHASPRTHWRRGHWRAAPGCALARGRGETVPLVFVRPCLVLGAGGEPAAPCYVTAAGP